MICHTDVFDRIFAKFCFRIITWGTYGIFQLIKGQVFELFKNIPFFAIFVQVFCAFPDSGTDSISFRVSPILQYGLSK